MAELKDLVDKLDSVNVNETDISISYNTQNKLLCNDVENLEENENISIKNDKEATTSNDKGSFSTTDSINEADTSMPISGDVQKCSSFNDGNVVEEIDNIKTEENKMETEYSIKDLSEQTDSETGADTNMPIRGASQNCSFFNDGNVMEENNVKTEENTIETVYGIQDLSEQTDNDTGTESVESILNEIQNNLLSDCNESTVKKEKYLLKLTLKARNKLLTTLTLLQNHYVKLLQQKLNLLLLKKEVLQNTFNALINAQSKDLTGALDQITEETRVIFCQQKEVYAKCKPVFEAFVHIIETVEEINVPKTILDQYGVYFSMLENIVSQKPHIDSSITASEEFEILLKNCIKISSEDSENEIDLFLAAIDKANIVCTELNSFGNVIKELLDSIEFCTQTVD